jgi:hypothetical protein
MVMLSRRSFMKGLFTSEVVLGSTSLDIYPAHLLSHLENGKAKKNSQLPKIKVTGLGAVGRRRLNTSAVGLSTFSGRLRQNVPTQPNLEVLPAIILKLTTRKVNYLG